MSTGKYTRLTQREHVLKRPNMYISSVKLIKAETEDEGYYVYEDNIIKRKKMDYNEGLNTIIKEITSNASDHSIRDKTCTEIRINIKDDEISVMNNGDEGIEVEIDEKEKIWIPELIFCNFLTSSSYTMNDKDRVTNSINGIGAKATNVFSKYFTVEVVDMKRKKKYVQTCRDNLSVIEKPVITDNKSGKSYTKITFKPDYERFGITGLTEDIINSIHKQCIDLSYCTRPGVKVYFNDELIRVKTIDDYVKLYYPDSDIYEVVDPRWDIGVIYNPDEKFGQVSFINNNITPDGGSHIEYIVNAVTKSLVQKIKQRNKGLNIRQNHIRDYMMVFVKGTISCPEYTSQTKTQLKNNMVINGKPIIQIPDELIDNLMKSTIVEKAINFAMTKAEAELKKTDGRKTTRIDIDKYRKAKLAGTARSRECRLIITEGLSAATFALYGLEVIGSDLYGIYPIRGKMLNPRDESVEKVKENQEINDLKKIIGLKQGEDYSKQENLNKLNYGGILILTDQDLDGYHIKGLVMNFVHTFWRELAMVDGFFQTIQTPILKATKGKEVLKFYTEQSYNTWRDEHKTEMTKWYVKYYKGLGTSEEAEAKECFEDFEDHLLSFKWEPELVGGTQTINQEITPDLTDTSDTVETVKKTRRTVKKKKIITYKPTVSDDAILLAFDKDRINDRKDWLINYDKNDVFDYDENNNIPYSKFINGQLKHFSNYDNERSIPSVIDGLKPSQRKILYTMMKKNYNTKKLQIKVANLASETSSLTNYLHGEVSLSEAIINMAQNYVGTNNLELIKGLGNFGSRVANGKDAAASRYIYCHLSDLAPYIIRKEDDVVLKYLEVEGVKVEPEVYYPIIEMNLVNTNIGIGTGFSSSVPQYNPIDVIDALILMLEDRDDEIKPFIPWSRFYKGEVTKYDGTTYISSSVYEIINKNRENIIHITELPIGISSNDYVDSLKIKKTGKYKEGIKYIDNYSSPSAVDITITLEDGYLQDWIKRGEIEKNLKLIKTIKTTNMVLHGEDGKIIKFGTVQDILTYFYNKRLRKYDERKKYYIKILKNELEILRWKIKFINDYINKVIIIERKKKQEVIDRLKELGYPKLSTNINAIDTDDDNIEESTKYKSYSYIIDMKIFSLTEEKIKELEDKTKNKKEELELYMRTPIRQLWKNELLELREKYLIWEENVNKEREANDKYMKKKPQRRTTKRQTTRKAK